MTFLSTADTLISDFAFNTQPGLESCGVTRTCEDGDQDGLADRPG